MHKYIIMGVQGCGKGTQAKLLAKDFDLVHISVGDIFRWNIQSHTKLAARIKRHVASGGLVPDEIVEEVVQDAPRPARLELRLHPGRLPAQPRPGRVLSGELRHRRRDPDRRPRRGGSRTHLESAAVPQLRPRLQPDLSPPGAADVCDVCGGPLTAREDDTPAAVRQRLADYHSKTEPVLDLFRRKELIAVADGTGSVPEVQQDIRRQLRLVPT